MTRKDFYQYHAYGEYHTKDNEVVPFNRFYQPLEDNNRWVENIKHQVYFYDDWTPWEEKISNSEKRKAINKVHA
jgi:hypothetical protein